MVSGIYRITNKINGHIYIGSAKNIRGRWGRHLYSLRLNKSQRSILQSAWNKYGEQNFMFEVLLYCDPINLIFYEQLAIDKFHPEYNVCKIAGSTLGRILTDETKEKIRQALTGKTLPLEQRLKISKAGKGRIASEETRRKLRDRTPDSIETRIKKSISKKGNQWNVGHKHSPETIAKQSAGVKRNRQMLLASGVLPYFCGENSTAAKLNEQQVLEIRAKHIPHKYGLITKLATEYGVSPSQIRNIVHNRSWRHI